MIRKKFNAALQALMKFREALASFLFYKAILLLVLGLGLLAGTITYAILYGYYPDCSPEDWPMNHGPWRYYFFFSDMPTARLGRCLCLSFSLIELSTELSIFSMILKFTRWSLFLFALCAGSFIVSMIKFYWLID